MLNLQGVKIYFKYLDTEVMGKMDPFVVIKYDNKSFKTKVAEDSSKNPNWVYLISYNYQVGE